MVHYTCDMCGKTLLSDEDVRYVVKIEVYAAYDPMELTDEDLLEDHASEIEAICHEIAELDQGELEDSVYKEMEFDLCPGCQKRYIRDPLFKSRQRIRFKEYDN